MLGGIRGMSLTLGSTRTRKEICKVSEIDSEGKLEEIRRFLVIDGGVRCVKIAVKS